MPDALLLWEREASSRVPRTTPAAARRLPRPRPLMAGERPGRRVAETMTVADPACTRCPACSPATGDPGPTVASTRTIRVKPAQKGGA